MKRNVNKSIKFNHKLRVSLIFSLLFMISSYSSASTKEKCQQDYQDKLSTLLNDREGSARKLAEKVLGHSFQKLAYANHLFAGGTESERKEFENNINKYLSKNKSETSMSTDDVMKHLKQFSDPFKNATTKAQSSRAAVKNATKEKLEALKIFSRSLDKKFHIKDYENDALRHFDFESNGKAIDGWNLFVGDIARNFYQRQFVNDEGQQVFADRDFSKAKVAKYDSDVKKATQSLKNDILKMAQGISDECKSILREIGHSTGQCNLADPYDEPTKSLILSTENILSKINNPESKFIQRPISVHYLGAHFHLDKCEILEDPDHKGKYKVNIKMDYKYIPGADNRDWSMTVNGASAEGVIWNDRNEGDSNKTLQTFSDEVSFSDLELEDGLETEMLNFNFKNSTGKEVKMYTISDNYEDRDINPSTNGSDYTLRCQEPKPTMDSAPEETPDSYIISAANNSNTITLSISKNDEDLNLAIDELKDASIEWKLPEGLACEENPDDKLKLVCKVNGPVTSKGKASFKLINHKLTPPPADGSVDLEVQEAKNIEIDIKAENNLETEETTLTAKVTGAGENPEIKWELVSDKEEEKEDSTTGQSITKPMFKKATYKVTVKGKSVEKTINNVIKVKIKSDGKNDSKDKEVNLIASVDKKFKDIKGSYSWKCDGKECGSDQKIQLKRTDKKQSITVEFTTAKKAKSPPSSAYDIDPLKKDDKKDNEEECEEEDKDVDPFSSKKKEGCKPKKDDSIKFAPKYMPPMSQPLILPPSQPFITPGFN